MDYLHKYYKRGFLNESEGMAAFEAEINIESMDRKYLSATFNITDCNRKVSLDFTCYDRDDPQKTLYKIDCLMNELTSFKTDFNKALEIYNTNIKEKNDKSE